MSMSGAESVGGGALVEAGVSKAGPGEAGGALAIARFCLVENQNPGVLAAVATLVGEQRLNIVGNTCKARGALSFQVLDIEVRAAELRRVELPCLETTACELTIFTISFVRFDIVLFF